jgi:hypothetical protein
VIDVNRVLLAFMSKNEVNSSANSQEDFHYFRGGGEYHRVFFVIIQLKLHLT